MIETREPRVLQYSTCLEKLNLWLEQNLGAGWKESWGPDSCFAPILYAQRLGRYDWAESMLGHVINSHLSPDGSLKQSVARQQMLAYVPAWFAWAAFDSEHFSFGNQLLDFVESLQSGSGAVFGNMESKKGKRGSVDFDSTAMAVVAFAKGARAEPCLRAARFLLRLSRSQPSPDTFFSTNWREPEGLYKPDSSAGRIDWSQPDQHYYKIGLFVVAMVYAYGISRQSDFLREGLTVYDRTLAQASGLWNCTFSHKLCWAAGCLYRLTGQERFLVNACRLADHLASLQQGDGLFHYPELWPRYPPPNPELLPNASFQFGLWIARTLSLIRGSKAV